MILLCYGTRPEYLKIKPLISELTRRKKEFKVLFSGQHEDIAAFGFDFKLVIEDGPNRLDSIVKSVMNALTEILLNQKITYVLVQGDTTTAMSLALSAFHHKVKIIHLEAGLRTKDVTTPYPEEANRQIISRIADIHFCPTYENMENLLEDNVNHGKKYVVGNTSLDNLIEYKKKTYLGNKVLVTLHRRENHDIINDYFEQIAFLSTKYPDLEFILPIHPNPNVQKYKHIFDDTSVKVIDPLPHNELLTILVGCYFVITDSGGLQEECNFLDKFCIVCRESTERPEAIGMTTIMCKSPLLLEGIVSNVYENPVPYNEYPFGDGTAAKQIVDIFENLN